MDAKRWQRAQELFLEILEARPEDRGRLLDDACGDDPDLRSMVARLLRGDEEAPSILALGHDELAGLVAESTRPRRLGPYEIVGELGQGGMGTVYEAERVDGRFQRRVALKVIRAGLGADALRRFQSEGRILARLEHPGIARLYDAGVHHGQPYLVMELLRGERIDRHCDRERLDLRGRLRLFLQVCDAVHFAHQNLVVHRDLKPSNILVTPDGDVRLLDFGIAKLLHEDGHAHHTRTGFRALTPEYSSPEQVRGEPVGTASDVYSLGVVLYELLTGRPPYGSSETPLDVARSVVERDPRPPSSVANPSSRSSTGQMGAPPDKDQNAAGIAAKRGVTAQRLSRALGGDLDTIVLKALQKEPARRYSSVQALADDVRRHLDGQPVSARPDRLSYRARKFVRRHAVGVAATAALTVSLVGGLAVALWQARVASSQRDVARLEAEKATRVTDFLIDVFEVADPAEARADTLTAAQILRRGAERVESELEADPLVQATVIDAIGRVYGRLSLFEEAEALLRRALDRRTRLLGRDHPEVARSLHNLAELYRSRSDPAADSLYREAIALQRRVLEPGNPELAYTLLGRAFALISRDDAEAESHLDEALSIFRSAAGDHETAIASVTYAKGFIRQIRGQFGDAERLYREALAVQLERLGPTQTETLTTRYNLGFLLQTMGRYQAADSALQAVLAARREVYGDRHQRVSNSLYGLAELRYAQGDYPSAEAYIREAIDVRTALHGANSDQVVSSSLLLALILNAQGDTVAAEALFDRLLASWEDRSRGRLTLARALNGYAGFLQNRGQLEEAEAFYRRALELYRSGLGDRHPFTAIVQGNVAAVLHDRGDLAGAEPLYRGALAVLRDAYTEEHASVGATRMRLGTLECQLDRFEAGERNLREALAVLERVQPAGHQEIGQATMRLGACVADQGRHDEALNLLESARTIIEPQRRARVGDWRQLLTELFDLHTAMGQSNEAAEFQRLFMETEGG